MRRFENIESFSLYLRGRASAAHQAQQAGLHDGCRILLREVKASIGHYQSGVGPFSGWAPLSSATLDGFEAPGIGRVKGKEELGFAPPDNPLLRTGTLRDSYGYSVDFNHAVVGSNAMNAVWQEMGTPGARFPIRSPGRPVLGPAAFRHGEAVAHAVARRVLAALAGSTTL